MADSYLTGQGDAGFGSHSDLDTRIVLRFDNRLHIAAAYGAAAASRADEALRQEILDLGGIFEIRDNNAPDILHFSCPGMAAREAGAMLENALARFVQTPISGDTARFHASLSWAQITEETQDEYFLPPVTGPALEWGDDWAHYYRADMALAVRVFSALDSGKLALAWQPVLAAEAPERLLYHEALTRVETEEAISPGLLFPALERLGLTRLFDRHVMLAVLKELERFPDAIIGVNLSGASASHDGWWVSLFERLQQNPEIARRLVIEITETTHMAESAIRFVTEVQALGCRIALDDFGVGHASIRNAVMIEPDIVKVDAYFMHNAAISDDIRQVLRHLTGIAASIASEIIIEGVEDEAQSRMAMEIQAELAPQSGGCWQQGYWLGRPSVERPWEARS